MCLELLTNGDIPYNEISANDNVIAHVRGGGRLARPVEEEHVCPDQLWDKVYRQLLESKGPARVCRVRDLAGHADVMGEQQDPASHAEIERWCQGWCTSATSKLGTS